MNKGRIAGLLIFAMCAATFADEIEWEWDAVEGATGYRWQLDAEDADGWTYEDADTTSLVTQDADPAAAYTLYVQSTTDGVTWTPSDALVAEPAEEVVAEAPEEAAREEPAAEEATEAPEEATAESAGEDVIPASEPESPDEEMPEEAPAELAAPRNLEWRWESESGVMFYRYQVGGEAPDGDWIVVDVKPDGFTSYRLENVDVTIPLTLYIQKTYDGTTYSPSIVAPWSGNIEDADGREEGGRTLVIMPMAQKAEETAEGGETPESLEWRWACEPGVAQYRYQLDSEDDDGWTYADATEGGEIVFRLSNIDHYKTYTLYVQSSPDGRTWSDSVATVWRASYTPEPEPEPEGEKFSLALYGTYGTEAIWDYTVRSGSSDKKHAFRIDASFGWKFSDHWRFGASLGAEGTVWYNTNTSDGASEGYRYRTTIPLLAGIELVSPQWGPVTFFAGAYAGWHVGFGGGSAISTGPAIRPRAGLDFSFSKSASLYVGTGVDIQIDILNFSNAWGTYIFIEPVSCGVRFLF